MLIVVPLVSITAFVLSSLLYPVPDPDINKAFIVRICIDVLLTIRNTIAFCASCVGWTRKSPTLNSVVNNVPVPVTFPTNTTLEKETVPVIVVKVAVGLTV